MQLNQKHEDEIERLFAIITNLEEMNQENYDRIEKMHKEKNSLRNDLSSER